jgi:hypothetical protein
MGQDFMRILWEQYIALAMFTLTSYGVENAVQPPRKNI